MKIKRGSSEIEAEMKIRKSKYFFYNYRSIYQSVIPTQYLKDRNSKILDIGSSGSLLSEIMPQIIRTDIEGKRIDLKLNAMKLPLKNKSIDCLVLKDSLHHIPDVEKFFLEAERVLKDEGVICVADPYWGPIAKIIFKYFHPEKFDDKVNSLVFNSSNPWDSNQALLKLILRNTTMSINIRQKFVCEELGPINGLSYILSGGLYGTQIVPASLLIKLNEFELRHLNWLKIFGTLFLVRFKKITR